MTTINCGTLNASVSVNSPLGAITTVNSTTVNSNNINVSSTITCEDIGVNNLFTCNDLQVNNSIACPTGTITADTITSASGSIGAPTLQADVLQSFSGSNISVQAGTSFSAESVSVGNGLDVGGVGNFQNDIDLNNANIANVTNLDVTTITSNNGSDVTLSGPYTLIANNVDSQFASIHYNSLGGASALRAHSTSDITYNDTTCNDNGELISTNGLSGVTKNISALVNYAYSLGPNVVASTLVITTAGAFTLMSGFSTFIGRNWVKTSNLILTYTGNIPRTCFITASVSVQGTLGIPDEIDACVALNATINGNNEITGSTELIETGRVIASNVQYGNISGNLVFQFNVNTNDTVCFALRNNTAIRNISYIFNNFTIRMSSAGIDS